MKIWKHYGIISFLVIYFFTFIFIACDEDIKCLGRTDTAIDDIDCGGKNCYCSPKVFGNVWGIPIYRVKNIIADQAEIDTIEMIKSYNELQKFLQADTINVKIPERLTAIHIVEPYDLNKLGLKGTIFKLQSGTPYPEINGRLFSIGYDISDEVWNDILNGGEEI